ncbi:MAG: molybdenum cofactor biosynthesis protein C [Olpidium bornovanus]|uniref:cyclic pyranopterin monophosphate synthase n=1 Tax=Olpidium bornovanus TaxID=278681 RepID=A0A8H7ZZN9_9FUNG|nr:MAG: molybdenum cofactor biosynthesis protein C [Olpidium bornovanus]
MGTSKPRGYNVMRTLAGSWSLVCRAAARHVSDGGKRTCNLQAGGWASTSAWTSRHAPAANVGSGRVKRHFTRPRLSPSASGNTFARLTHVDSETGSPAMVDISSKPATARAATAIGHVLLPQRTRELLLENAARTKKGDVLGVAQIAGIAAAKKTSDLVPLCHPLAITHVSVDLEVARDEPPRIDVRASVRTDGKTGVEMEALCAVSVAALTVYDMCKAAGQEGLEITGIKVVEKAGGVSGNWKR